MLCRLQATGELEGGAAASTVLHLLQDVNGIMTLQNNNALGSPHDTFKRLTGAWQLDARESERRNDGYFESLTELRVRVRVSEQ